MPNTVDGINSLLLKIIWHFISTENGRYEGKLNFGTLADKDWAKTNTTM